MIFFLYFILFLWALYFVLIMVFTFAWMLKPDFTKENTTEPEGLISVIIPCKNELINLPALLASLKQQTYPNVEIILVDDHSSDDSLIFLSTTSAPNIKVLPSNGTGKKAALQTGIEAARANLIVTLDADVTCPENWLKTIADFYVETKADFIIMPVKMDASTSLFERLQQIEFSTLIGSGGGAALAYAPVMCNGANLAFTKELWLDCRSDLKTEYWSGDDMFLLQAAKRKNYSIAFLKSKDVLVSIAAKSGLGDFLKQRSRWTSKSGGYTDLQIIITGLAVFGLTLMIPLSLLAGFVNPYFFLGGFVLFLLKYLTDLIFLVAIRSFFDLKKVGSYGFLLSVLYPFYVFISVVGGLFRKQRW